MYQNLAYPTNMNTRPPFEKSFINAQLCPQNTWRRPPFPYVKRNMMPGRYINVGIRPTSHRPNTPMPYKYIPGIKYPGPNSHVVINTPIGQRPQFFLVSSNAVGNQINQHIIPLSKNNESKIAVENSSQYWNNPILSNSMTNLPTGITPTFIQSQSTYSVPSNIFHSQNNQRFFPIVNNSGCQSTTAASNQLNGLTDPNTFSGLTFQPTAPGRGIHFNNTNTAESDWNKCVNDCMPEFHEAQQTAIPSQIEQCNKIRVDYQSQNMQDQSFNRAYINAFHSKNLSMTAKLIMLPTNISIAPSQNICNAAPLNISNAPLQNYFLPHADITQQNIANCDIRAVMPPPVFQNPVFSQNLSSNILINECNHNVTQNVLASTNITENNSNLKYNSLSLTKTDHIAERHKNTSSSSNLIYSNQNSIQNCLWYNTNDNNKSATTNEFLINEKKDSSNNNSSIDITNNSEQTANSLLINNIKKEPLFDSRNSQNPGNPKENPNVKALSSNPPSSIKVEKESSAIFEEHLNEKLGDVKSVTIQSINTADYTIDRAKCGSPLNLKKK